MTRTAPITPGTRFIGLTILFAGSCAPEGNAMPGPQTAEPANESFEFTPDPRRQYPQIARADAPTVAQLKARGIEQSDWDAEPFACGPACDAVHVYAVFMGRRARYPAQSEHLYTCPNPGRPMQQEEWRCAPYSGMKERPRD